MYNHAALSILSFLETLYLRNPWLRRAAAIAICIYPILNFARATANLPKQRLIDLFVRYVAATILQHGGDIYSLAQLKAMADRIGGVRYGTAFSNLLLGYTHPPSDTFFELRFAFFAYPIAKWVYLAESTLLYAGCAFLLWQSLKPMAPRRLHWALPIILFGLFAPTGASLGLGQTDVTIFFFMIVAFWAFSRGRDLVAGLAIAIAVFTKLVPGLLLVYFLWKREWRVVAYAAGAMAGVFLVSLPVIGVERWIEYVTQILPALSTGTAYAQNQSLPGLINRLMLEPRFASGLQSAPNVPIVRAAITATQIALCGLALIVSRRRLASRLDLRFGLEYGVWLTVILLVSPVSWDHYFVWMLLPIIVILVKLLNSGAGNVYGLAMAASVLFGLWLINTPPGSYFTNRDAWQKSPLLFGALIILLLLFILIKRPRPEIAATPNVIASPQLGTLPTRQ